MLKGISKDLSKRLLNWWHSGCLHENGRVWSYVPFSFLAPDSKKLLNHDWLINNWHLLMFPNAMRMLSAKGFDDVDILYIDNIFQPAWIDNIKYRKLVFRVMDDHSGFPGAGKNQQKSAEYIAAKADVVVYSARELESYVYEMKPFRTAYVPNGVDYHSFSFSSEEKKGPIETIPQPIAVYAGAMSEWFDFKLMRYAAKKLPDVSFVLIGPDQIARKQLKDLKNIYLTGPIPHHRLKMYLHHAKVGLIPFNVKAYPQLINGVNPLKLYEYMACGLPVVSVDWREIRRLDSPAVLCSSFEEFITALKQLLENPPHSKTKFYEFSLEHDWKKKYLLLLDALAKV